ATVLRRPQGQDRRRGRRRRSHELRQRVRSREIGRLTWQVTAERTFHMITIIGAGKMGEALLAGLLAKGHTPQGVLVAEPRVEHAKELRDRYGIEVVLAEEAAKRANTLPLALEPQDLPDRLTDVGHRVRPGALVISVAAGLTTGALEERVPQRTPVVRAIPNTPAL